MDPFKDMKMKDYEFADRYQKKESLLARRTHSFCHMCPFMNDRYVSVGRQRRLADRIQQIGRLLSSENLALFPDYQQRVSVLETLGYVSIDLDHTVQLKGRVACEVINARFPVANSFVFSVIRVFNAGQHV